MEQATAAFTDYLLQVQNLLIVGAVYTLLGVTSRVFPKIKKHSVWARVAPAAPILLCSAAVWIPGAGPVDVTIGSRIMLGIVLGAVTANAHKILHQTALGRDDRINGRIRKGGP